MSSSGGPDLFVICKTCGSEVSPYITECPYCGNRLRKRAPKLDRPDKRREPDPAPRPRRSRRRPSLPKLRRMRAGAIPGIAPDRRPDATLAVVAISLAVLLASTLTSEVLVRLPVDGPLRGEWWRLVTASFAYFSPTDTGYAFCALVAIGVFGWLVERRHGPAPMVAVLLAGGVAGMAVVAVVQHLPVALGGNAAALALVGAWAARDLLALRRRVAIDGDLLGAATVAAVILALPIVISDANALAGVVGLGVGLALGAVLAVVRPTA